MPVVLFGMMPDGRLPFSSSSRPHQQRRNKTQSRTPHQPSRSLGRFQEKKMGRRLAAFRDDNNDSTDTAADASSPPQHSLQPGDKVQVEVVSFGTLGASVDVIADSHDPDSILPEDMPPLAQGLISQQEIGYFRASRGYLDVVMGEILPGYVERAREDDNKLSITLRSFGGKAKAKEIGQQILDRLEMNNNNILPVGDKSSPQDIAREFPGVSKGSFKKAVAALYKQKRVRPGPYTVEPY